MSITVRGVRPEDAEAIGEIYCQPLACRGTLQVPYPDAGLWRERLEKPSPGHRRLVACLDERVIGHAGLHVTSSSPRRQHAAGIGMAVHDAFHRQGAGRALMTALVELADGWLNLHRLELGVFVDNEPAIALYRAFGFEQEGVQRAYAFRDGAYVDTLIMARLRVPAGIPRITAEG